MRKVLLFLSMLLLALTVNAQRYVRCYGAYPTYGRVVYHQPYYERPYVDVVYVEKVVREKKQPSQIVVNNYVVNEERKRYVQVNESFEYGDNSYVSIDTNEKCLTTPTFDYDDMWSQTIWFKEDSYRKIRTDGKIALENIALFLEEHKDAKIIIEGYASRRHGTYSYNKNLAANRLKTISHYLVNVYHINWDRIEMKVIGSDDAKYDEDSWNQCVVINCKR